MKKHIIKRTEAVLLAILMTSSMTGCGSRDESSGKAQQTKQEGFVYQAEWLTDGEAGNGTGYDQIHVMDNKVFFVRSSYTDDMTKTELCSLDLNDASAAVKAESTLSEYHYDNTDGEAAGKEETQTEGEDSETEETPATIKQVMMAVPAADDTVFMIESESPDIQPDYEDESFDYEKYYSDLQKNTKIYLKKAALSGTELFRMDITEQMKTDDDDFYLNFSMTDSKGNLYLSDGSHAVWIFDSEGNPTGKIPLENNKDYSSIISMNIIDGDRLAVLQYGADDVSMEIRIYDSEKKAFGDAYTGLPVNCYNSGLTSLKDGKILLSNSEGAFSYDPGTQTYTQILKWMDCDLTPDYVRGVYALNGGDYLISYEDWNTGRSDLIRLKKTDAADVVQKEILTLGVIYTSQDIQADVVNFNKSSDKYRIEIKDYTSSIEYSEETYDKDYSNAVTQFNNDIVSGALDMFATDSINVGNLIAKGAVEDLNPYLGTSKLQKSNLMESVIGAIEKEGILYCIPQSFSITMLAGRTEDLGDRASWTMADVKALCDKYPDASIMPNATRDQVLYTLLMYDFDSYVDWENGTCSFNQEAFKQLLELAAEYPSSEEFDWDNDYVSNPKMLRNHDALLESCYIGQITDWKTEEQIFGCPVTFIGYPSSSFNGIVANIAGGICISSASANKDACWQFIESGIMNLSADSGFYGDFSIRKDIFDEQAAKEMKNGEYMYSWDDVEIKVEAVTGEDVDAVKALIDQIGGICNYDQDVALMNIITEEAEGYFTGQKSLEDVTNIIQSRANIYINENR